jgi:ribonuclease E
MRGVGENSEAMPTEPLSPELVLVDPELAARARAALPMPTATPSRSRPTAAGAPAPAATPIPAPAPSPADHRARYPLWARVTAALWVLVIGILIGGAAIPHAKEKPTVVPRSEDVTFCERPQPAEPSVPTPPLGPIGNPRSIP